MAFPDFPNEAPTPQTASLHAVVRYYFEENERRAAESVAGLSDADFNHDPGHGAWSIGQLVKHQIDLIGMMAETLSPGSTADLPKVDVGTEGSWNVAGLAERRAALAERFLGVFESMTPEGLMELRPEAYPPRWKEWPLLMRMLRPLLDIATHIGQVNYARRQLDVPVGTSRGDAH